MATVKRKARPKKTYEVSIALTDSNGARGANTLCHAERIGDVMDIEPSPMDTLVRQLGYDPDNPPEDALDVTALSISIRQVS